MGPERRLARRTAAARCGQKRPSLAGSPLGAAGSDRGGYTARVPPKSVLPVRPLTLSDALQRSAPLTALAARMQASNARFDAVGGALPAALRAQVKPGPIDDEGWSLLAANNAVAAKLRHLLPLLERLLREQGFEGPPIRVRITGS